MADSYNSWTDDLLRDDSFNETDRLVWQSTDVSIDVDAVVDSGDSAIDDSFAG